MEASGGLGQQEQDHLCGLLRLGHHGDGHLREDLVADELHHHGGHYLYQRMRVAPGSGLPAVNSSYECFCPYRGL